MVNRGQITATVAGLLLIVLGCLLQIYWTGMLHNFLKEKFILNPKSEIYTSWVKNQVPIYCKFYFFNWTNPTNVLKPDYKPEFREVGPYVFTETMEKVDLAWHDNGTVSYRIKRVWYFDEESSSGSLSDNITSANPVAAAVKQLSLSFSMSTISRLAAPKSYDMAITKTVDELLFSGYQDELIDLGRFSEMFFAGVKKIPFDKFGYMYSLNNSVGDVYTIETGKNGMDSFGEIRLYDHKSTTKFYESPCGKVRGSGGNFWKWGLQGSDEIVLFSGELCRYINLKFRGAITYEGLPSYKYSSGVSLVDNGTLDSRNRCFCNNKCVRVGVFDASKCSKDAPVFISYPHFQFADPYYTNAVIGMEPDREDHDMYLIIEPTYGTPLEMSARIQVNLLLKTAQDWSTWDSSREEEDQDGKLFFPILWLDQSFRIQPKDLETMKLLVQLPTMGHVASIVMMITGAVLLAVCYLRRFIRRKQTVPFGEIHKATENGGKDNKFNYLKDSRI